MNTTIYVRETRFTTPSDREIRINRTVNAPRALVFEAITAPRHVIHWYGPRGWTLPVCQYDLRPGGAWRHVCKGPDGTLMGMRGVYREIKAPEHLVTTESFDDYPGESINTLTLIERDGQTHIQTNVCYPDPEIRDAVLGSGMPAGAAETYDRLAEYLQSLQ